MDAPPLELKVNGADEALPIATVADLLGAKGLDVERKGIAVALNGAVVPRRAWAGTRLASGDAVEIITAKQGG
ncbi:sulfur carrier protein ThiS [Xanthobacter variabilis]|uniref:sulfur carrier protein ThiS n=1 Tax=Xanthobacter variabilis TaxID=3119932 RepID=UPI00374E241F